MQILKKLKKLKSIMKGEQKPAGGLKKNKTKSFKLFSNYHYLGQGAKLAS